VAVRDIARGGALLASDWALAAGTPLELELQGAGGSVMGRVVHSGRGNLALVFSYWILSPLRASTACSTRSRRSAPRPEVGKNTSAS
jgi:hypothetical protein